MTARNQPLFTILLMTVISTLTTSRANANEGSNILTLIHANIVDVQRSCVRQNVSIEIENGKIKKISSDANGPVRPATSVYDVKNAFVMPALCDMHVHGITVPGWPELFVANGVMTVRDMGEVSMRPINALKRSISQGQIFGPRIYACGKILDGVPVAWPGACQPVTNPREGRQAVLDHIEHKADFIKVYSGLRAEVYEAIVDQCKKSSIVFAGHVPSGLTDSAVSDAGQKSIEHLNGLYQDCVKDGAIAYSNNKTRIATFCLQHLDEHSDNGTVDALCKKFVHNNTFLCPTLATLRSMAYGDVLLKEKAALHGDYIPPKMLEHWDWTKDKRTNRLSASNWSTRKLIWERYKPLVKKIHENGVKFLCGTDLSNPYTYPGASVHDELALFVEFGFSPAEALKTATIIPAEYFGTADSTGSVEANKVADLVIVKDNPLLDIRNTRTIVSVVYHGLIVDREALDRLERQGIRAHNHLTPTEIPVDKE